MNWLRVTKKNPCPVCGKPDWCGVSADGTMAICMRRPSPHPARNGGSLHILSDPIPKYSLPPPSPPRKPKIAVLYFWEKWRRKTDPYELEDFADALGVDACALDRIGAARARNAWVFPMRNGAGQIVGIRFRGDDGGKWALRGSAEGLFFDATAPDDRTAIICEGPTDTAAVMTLGYYAVGRPSCRGAVQHTKDLLKRQHIKRAVIVSDNDEIDPHTGRRPGQSGAAALAAQLSGILTKIITPPAKDIRQAVAGGLSRTAFETLLSVTQWRDN